MINISKYTTTLLLATMVAYVATLSGVVPLGLLALCFVLSLVRDILPK